MVINVIPRGNMVDGKKLEEFVRIYWEALCPVPRNDNPDWDNDGSKDGPFNNTVNESLYMLSFSRFPLTGTGVPAAAVTRDIEIPADKGLFIPVMSVIVSACEVSGNLISIANQDQSSILPQSPPKLSLELDGTPLTTLGSYICTPGAIGQFQVNFPTSDAIFNIPNNSGPCNAVAGGRYVWTEPLSSNEKHKVQFKGYLKCNGSSCIDPEYIEDITYNITVK